MISLILNRFGGNGIYILDEPEAALSPSGQMTLLCLIHKLVKKNSQFIIETHSPILMAYSGAVIYSFDSRQLGAIPYEETERYKIIKKL